jgi:ribose 5-phosphate isomerase A
VNSFSELWNKQLDINVVDINDVGHVDLAIDGADEVDVNINLIKGGGYGTN